jgi:Tfp pilus assembly protein PilO
MNKSFAIPILLFIVFLIFTYLIMPEYNTLGRERQKLEEREVELENVENYYENIENHFEEMKNYEDGLNKINSALPDSISLSAVANFLQSVSSESGVFLEEISMKGSIVQPISKKNEDTEKNLPNKVLKSSAEIRVTGYYENFKNFIQLIESSARLIEVEKISLSGAKTEETPALDLSLIFYSY